jgi:hypothetical protein
MRRILRFAGVAFFLVALNYKMGLRGIFQPVMAQSCGGEPQCTPQWNGVPPWQNVITDYQCFWYDQFYFPCSPFSEMCTPDPGCHASQCTMLYWCYDYVCAENGQFAYSECEFGENIYCDYSIIVSLPECCGTGIPPVC